MPHPSSRRAAMNRQAALAVARWEAAKAKEYAQPLTPPVEEELPAAISPEGVELLRLIAAYNAS
jgi:hypothetical protein